MRCYHFLKADMTAGSGNEPAWTVGETRTHNGPVKLCESDYHASATELDALQYAPRSDAPMLCEVEVEPVERDDESSPGQKMVSATRTLLSARNVERELRLFACDCAERALRREREAGHEPDPRSWNAITVARRFAAGEATAEELAAADAAARADAAAWAAAWAAAAARAAADAAAWAAAWAAADAAAAAWATARDGRDGRNAEIDWQRTRLHEILSAVPTPEVTE